MATTPIATQHSRHHTKQSKSEKLLEETQQLQEHLRNLAGSASLTDAIARAMSGKPATPPAEPVSAAKPPGTPAPAAAHPPAPQPAQQPEQQPAPQPAPNKPKARSPEPSRHTRKCTICRHPEREAIEQAFLQWDRPETIVHYFHIEDERYLRRHAQATGLCARRRQNVCVTLENILERGDEFEITASAYIRAVRSYVCLTDSTQWVEPATRVIISSGDSSIGSQAAPRRRRPGSVRVPPANSNRPRPRLEIAVSRTKHRKEAGSNRP